MSYMIEVVDERWAAVSKAGIVTHEGQPVEGIELRLVPGTLIRGRVTVGPDQQPAAGQEVVLSEQGPFVNGRARLELGRRTMTDSEGRYQLRVGPGEYTLFVPPVIRSSGAFQIGNEPEIVRDFRYRDDPVLQLAGLVVRNAPGDQPIAGAIVVGHPIRHDQRQKPIQCRHRCAGQVPRRALSGPDDRRGSKPGLLACRPDLHWRRRQGYSCFASPRLRRSPAGWFARMPSRSPSKAYLVASSEISQTDRGASPGDPTDERSDGDD